MFAIGFVLFVVRLILIRCEYVADHGTWPGLMATVLAMAGLILMVISIAIAAWGYLP